MVGRLLSACNRRLYAPVNTLPVYAANPAKADRADLALLGTVPVVGGDGGLWGGVDVDVDDSSGPGVGFSWRWRC